MTEGETAEQLYKQIYDEGYAAGKAAAFQDVTILLNERRAYELEMLGYLCDYAYDAKDHEVVKAAGSIQKKLEAFYDIMLATHTTVQDVALRTFDEDLW